MVTLRQCFAQGDIYGCRGIVQALWAGRHNNKTFSADDASDAAWILDKTQGSPEWQRQLWPKLLGLLTRWAFLTGRSPGSTGSIGSSGPHSSLPFLQALQPWLATCLASNPLPWGARAPALLLIAVIGCSGPDSVVSFPLSAPLPPHVRSPSSPPLPPQPQPQPQLQLACQSLLRELQHALPAHLLLESPDAVTDLCTAVELVLERLAFQGDWRGLVSLLAALLAALGGAISELVGGVAATGPTIGLRNPQPPPTLSAQSGDSRSSAAAMAAAVQEAAAAALAALYASCRQIGSACARAVAVAAANVSAAAPTAAEALSAGKRASAGIDAGCGPGDWPPAAAAAVMEIVDHVHDAVAAAVAAAVAYGAMRIPSAAPATSSHNHVSSCSTESKYGTLGATCHAGSARRPIVGRGAAAAHSATDTWATLSVATAAAGGLLEGFAMAVRLQPLVRPQELLLRLIQPGTDLLSATLQEAATAAAAAADAAEGTAAAVPRYAVEPVLGFGAEPFGSAGGSVSPCALDAEPGVAVLNMAVGYCWARLRAQKPPPGPLQRFLHAADHMVAASAPAAVAGAGMVGLAEGPCWHPARGALAVLTIGSLGLGRMVRLAFTGASVDTATELLEGQFQGPLFVDAQQLAKTVIEALSAPAPAAAPGATAILASVLLSDAAAAARRLHLLYGSVADTAGGRAWLAALPATAMACLRELLDRAFVCKVSVMAAAHETLSTAAPPLPELALSKAGVATPGNGARQAVPATQVRAAAVALGALADLQFCALQLRAHGDLVARLSTDAASMPAAALPLLLALLPCYPTFASVYGGGAVVGGFAATPVAASRLAFLLPLAASCVPHAADVGAAACVVLPYIYLMLKAAPKSVVQAAHSTWAALLAGLCEEAAAAAAVQPVYAGVASSDGEAYAGRLRQGRRGVGEGGVDVPSAEERHRAVLAVAASMVPYYIERTCQEPCSEGDLELLEWGVRQVLQLLPESHPVKAWCTARLIRQLCDWAAQSEDGRAMEHPLSGTSERHEQKGSENAKDVRRELAPAGSHGIQIMDRRCAAIVAAVLTVLDFPLIPQALALLWSVLQLPTFKRALILQQLHDVWLSCNDYGRKQLLEDWLRLAMTKSGMRARL